MSRRIETILFYSSVNNLIDFEIQGFYREDVGLLKRLGYQVVCTNKLMDFLTLEYDVAFLYFYKKAAIAAFFARIKYKKVYFTGGVDDLAESMEISFFRKVLFKFLFVICYFFSHKINIVSLSDYDNVLRILKLIKINSLKILNFPHSTAILNLTLNCEFKTNDFISICWMSTIGNVKRKGLDKALVFFSSIYDISPDSKFYIVGTLGDGSDYLKSLDVYQRIKDRVVFTGFITDQAKSSLLCSSAYYIQFSNYEGFGLAALEANFHKCFIFHSGSGGFLISNDIWGKEINMSTQLDKEGVALVIEELNYIEELRQFNFRFDSFVSKYSSENRLNNFKKMLYD